MSASEAAPRTRFSCLISSICSFLGAVFFSFTGVLLALVVAASSGFWVSAILIASSSVNAIGLGVLVLLALVFFFVRVRIRLPATFLAVSEVIVGFSVSRISFDSFFSAAASFLVAAATFASVFVVFFTVFLALAADFAGFFAAGAFLSAVFFLAVDFFSVDFTDGFDLAAVFLAPVAFGFVGLALVEFSFFADVAAALLCFADWLAGLVFAFASLFFVEDFSFKCCAFVGMITPL